MQQAQQAQLVQQDQKDQQDLQDQQVLLEPLVQREIEEILVQQDQ